MEQFVGGLTSLAVVGAIIYALARAAARTTLAPIHAKLDRVLELQERLLAADAATLAKQSADEGAR